MVHRHGLYTLLNGIRPPQFRINHYGSEYSDNIIDFILCYPIVLVTSNSTVTDALTLSMQLSGKLIGSVDTIICGLTINWNSCTHGFPLKL